MTNNEMKLHTLNEMSNLVADFAQKLQVLEALDGDNTTSGAFDLHDQLTSLTQTIGDLDKGVRRAVCVVPLGVELLKQSSPRGEDWTTEF